MKKRAVVILSYEYEVELNSFLSKNGTGLEVSVVYEYLDAADVEHIEDILKRNYIE